MLDVVDTREPNEEKAEKVGFISWEGFACKDLEKISEVISSTGESAPSKEIPKGLKGVRMERHPFNIVKKNKPRCDEKLAKVFDINSFFLITLEIYS